MPKTDLPSWNRWTPAIDGEEMDMVDANPDKVVVMKPHPVGTTGSALNKKKKKFPILSGRVSALRFIQVLFPSIEIDVCPDLKSSNLNYRRYARSWNKSVQYYSPIWILISQKLPPAKVYGERQLPTRRNVRLLQGAKTDGCWWGCFWKRQSNFIRKHLGFLNQLTYSNNWPGEVERFFPFLKSTFNMILGIQNKINIMFWVSLVRKPILWRMEKFRTIP